MRPDFGSVADEIIRETRASMWAGGPDRSLILARLDAAYDLGRADERKGVPPAGTIEAVPRADGRREWLIW